MSLSFAACHVDNGHAPLRVCTRVQQNALAGLTLQPRYGRVVWYDWPTPITPALRAYWLRQASMLLNMAPPQRRRYTDTRLEPQILAPHNCNNPLLHGQWGIFARRPLPAHCVLGVYGGRYLTCYRHMMHELAHYGQQGFERYLFSADPKTGGLPYISGLQAANAITLVNDCRPADANTPRHQTMNCRPVVMRWQVPRHRAIAATFYISTAAIAAGQEVLTDYGDAFWQ